MDMEVEIQRLTSTVRNWGTVSQSAAALLASYNARVREFADNPDQIRALADEADKSLASLVEAVKINTPAASEPPVTVNPVTDAPVEPPTEVASEVTPPPSEAAPQ